MRIGFVTQEYPPEIGGGAGTYAYNLVTELEKLGHEIVVFTPHNIGVSNSFISSSGIKIVPIVIPSMPFSMIFYWLKLKKTVMNEELNNKFDVIHINNPTYWLPGKRLSNAPHIVTIHHLSQDYLSKRPALSKKPTSRVKDNERQYKKLTYISSSSLSLC